MTGAPCHLCAERDCAGHGRLHVTMIEHHARPWTTNAERAGNRWDRARLTKEWRTAFNVLARQQQAQRMKWASIIIAPRQKGGRLQDAGGCAPAAKAAIDGLVDAGVFADDSPEYVRSITYLRPTRGEPRLMLWIIGEPDHE